MPQQEPIIITPGIPCPCRPGRYVRFVIPPGIPGCDPAGTISCRPSDSVRHDEIREHAIPAGAQVWIRAPRME